MATLVRLGPGTSGGPLGISSEGAEFVQLTPNMHGVKLAATAAYCLSGANEGELIRVIKPKQVVMLRPPCRMLPRKYEVLLSVNPELLKFGDVSYPFVVEPGRPEDICVRLRCSRELDLDKLDYVFVLYQID